MKTFILVNIIFISFVSKAQLSDIKGVWSAKYKISAENDTVYFNEKEAFWLSFSLNSPELFYIQKRDFGFYGYEYNYVVENDSTLVIRLTSGFFLAKDLNVNKLNKKNKISITNLDYLILETKGDYRSIFFTKEN